MSTTSEKNTDESPLAELAELSGWHQLDPPTEEQWHKTNIIGNWKGKPIKSGFEIETVRDDGECLHKVYRTSKYDVHLKIENLGPHLAQGQVKVEEADGYENKQ